MIRFHATGLIILTLFIGAPQSFAAGNPAQGQRVFGACAACHSLQPDQNMTGPSLAGLWNRKAGTVASFSRYSPALRSANIVWNDKTLEDWITDPQQFVPGNEMTLDQGRSAAHRFIGVFKASHTAACNSRAAGRTDGCHGRHGRHDGGRTSS